MIEADLSGFVVTMHPRPSLLPDTTCPRAFWPQNRPEPVLILKVYKGWLYCGSSMRHHRNRIFRFYEHKNKQTMLAAMCMYTLSGQRKYIIHVLVSCRIVYILNKWKLRMGKVEVHGARFNGNYLWHASKSYLFVHKNDILLLRINTVTLGRNRIYTWLIFCEWSAPLDISWMTTILGCG